ncbi:MAG: diaminopimelate epimerase [Holosporales bacterium]|jgi:diaminopimelate epimerase|nr:diaminopimelate epimerase [Holosporales bacterium]
MLLKFHKAHGLGNDFVIIDKADLKDFKLTTDILTKIANRHEGIGCDQVILFSSNDLNPESADVWFFNQDGTEAETCGNGLRCLAASLHQSTGRREFVITTNVDKNVIKICNVCVRQDDKITVDMGASSFDGVKIPLQNGLDPMNVIIKEYDLCGTAVNIGNPHIVFFLDDPDGMDLSKIGPKIERHPYFPRRVNVSFAKLNSSSRIHMRVWERGAGITKACGSAACAVAAVARKKEMTQGRVTVTQPGGIIEVDIDENSGSISQTADAEIVFSGQMQI